MAIKFPVPAFNFKVTIQGGAFLFSEVSGLKVTTEFQEVRSGGLNNMHFKIPTKTTYGEVSMKRGVFIDGDDGSSKERFKEIIKLDNPSSIHKNKQFGDITIQLLSEKKTVVYNWILTNPVLVSWEFPTMNASANEVAFETLVFQPAGILLS